MGEAKRRGTFEQRKEMAIKRAQTLPLAKTQPSCRLPRQSILAAVAVEMLAGTIFMPYKMRKNG